MVSHEGDHTPEKPENHCFSVIAAVRKKKREDWEAARPIDENILREMKLHAREEP